MTILATVASSVTITPNSPSDLDSLFTIIQGRADPTMTITKDTTNNCVVATKTDSTSF